MPRILAVVDFIDQKKYIRAAARMVHQGELRCMAVRQAMQNAELEADVVVIEITPDLRQLPVVQRIRQDSPKCRIICLAAGSSRFGVNQLARAQIDAYVLLNGSDERRKLSILAELVEEKLVATAAS